MPASQVDPQCPGFPTVCPFERGQRRGWNHAAIYFAEPGTFILAVGGEKKFPDPDERSITENPKPGETWNGWVAVSGEELVTVDNQTIAFKAA